MRGMASDIVRLRGMVGEAAGGERAVLGMPAIIAAFVTQAVLTKFADASGIAFAPAAANVLAMAPGELPRWEMAQQLLPGRPMATGHLHASALRRGMSSVA